jgi:hypothetical protein
MSGFTSECGHAQRTKIDSANSHPDPKTSAATENIRRPAEKYNSLSAIATGNLSGKLFTHQRIPRPATNSRFILIIFDAASSCFIIKTQNRTPPTPQPINALLVGTKDHPEIVATDSGMPSSPQSVTETRYNAKGKKRTSSRRSFIKNRRTSDTGQRNINELASLIFPATGGKIY